MRHLALELGPPWSDSRCLMPLPGDCESRVLLVTADPCGVYPTIAAPVYFYTDPFSVEAIGLQAATNVTRVYEYRYIFA